MSFLDKMVKLVFYSTFILALATITIAWLKDWEQLLIMLVERWFTIMVGELIVTGAIQIVKQVLEAGKEIKLAKLEKEDNIDG